MKFEVNMLASYNGNGKNRNRRDNKDNKRDNNSGQKGDKLSWQDSLLFSSIGKRKSDNNDRRFNLSRESDSEPEETKNQVEDADAILSAFADEYADAVNCNDMQRVRTVISDKFWDVAKILYKFYYNREFEKIKPHMEVIVDAVSTSRFATTLRAIFADNELPEKWSSEVWEYAAFMLATTLETNSSRMKDETVTLYIELLTNAALFGQDITSISNKAGVTKELVTDMLVHIPVGPKRLNDVTLSHYAPKFIQGLLTHTEENKDVLSRSTQKILFEAFFGIKNKTALKAIGRMLSETKVGTFANESQQLIYSEYVDMLSEKLNDFDINEIKFVLRYIVEEGKKRPNDELTFKMISLSDNSNIRKALFALVEEDSSVKDVLL